MAPSNETIKQGWLAVQVPGSQVFVDYFVILRPGSIDLYHSVIDATQSTKTAVYHIILQNCVTIQPTENQTIRHGFEILVISGGLYLIRASSEWEKNAWLNTIDKVVSLNARAGNQLTFGGFRKYGEQSIKCADDKKYDAADGNKLVKHSPSGDIDKRNTNETVNTEMIADNKPIIKSNVRFSAPKPQVNLKNPIVRSVKGSTQVITSTTGNQNDIHFETASLANTLSIESLQSVGHNKSTVDYADTSNWSSKHFNSQKSAIVQGETKYALPVAPIYRSVNSVQQKQFYSPKKSDLEVPYRNTDAKNNIQNSLNEDTTAYSVMSSSFESIKHRDESGTECRPRSHTDWNTCLPLQTTVEPVAAKQFTFISDNLPNRRPQTAPGDVTADLEKTVKKYGTEVNHPKIPTDKKTIQIDGMLGTGHKMEPTKVELIKHPTHVHKLTSVRQPGRPQSRISFALPEPEERISNSLLVFPTHRKLHSKNGVQPYNFGRYPSERLSSRKLNNMNPTNLPNFVSEQNARNNPNVFDFPITQKHEKVRSWLMESSENILNNNKREQPKRLRERYRRKTTGNIPNPSEINEFVLEHSDELDDGAFKWYSTIGHEERYGNPLGRYTASPRNSRNKYSNSTTYDQPQLVPKFEPSSPTFSPKPTLPITATLDARPYNVNDVSHMTTVWSDMAESWNDMIKRERKFWKTQLTELLEQNSQSGSNLQIMMQLLDRAQQRHSDEMMTLWKHVYENWIPSEYLSCFKDSVKMTLAHSHQTIYDLFNLIDEMRKLDNMDSKVKPMGKQPTFIRELSLGNPQSVPGHFYDDELTMDVAKRRTKSCGLLENTDQPLQIPSANVPRSWHDAKDILRYSHTNLLEQIYSVAELVGAALDTDIEDTMRAGNVDIKNLGSNPLTNLPSSGLQVAAKLQFLALDLETRLDYLCADKSQKVERHPLTTASKIRPMSLENTAFEQSDEDHDDSTSTIIPGDR